MRVFIVDDHELIQLGMKTWIEANTEHVVSGCASSITSTIKEVEELGYDMKPEVYIVDADLGNESGMDLVRKIREKESDVKILVYSMHKEKGFYLDAKSSGANGYIVKDAHMNDFNIALEKIISGEDCFSGLQDSNNEKLQEAMKMLTPKEKLVFQEILKEESNDCISRKMNISIHTVEIYVSRIYDKLDIHFRSELISKYSN